MFGVSRQAVFQRYGKPIDPRTAEAVNTNAFPGVLRTRVRYASIGGSPSAVGADAAAVFCLMASSMAHFCCGSGEVEAEARVVVRQGTQRNRMSIGVTAGQLAAATISGVSGAQLGRNLRVIGVATSPR